jgi:hypothetical protein
MRATTLRPILVAAALAVAADAHAQSSGYVAGAAFADIRAFGSSRDIVYYGATEDDSLSGAAAGGGLRIGTFLHPRISLEVAIDAAARKSVDVSNPYYILATYPVGGVPEVKASTEFLTVGATLGYHPPTNRRVHFGYRGGVAFIRGVYQTPYPGYYALAAVTSSIALPPPYPTTIYPPPFTMVTERQLSVGLTLGMEAAVDVTKRIAVVPEIRLTTFSRPYDGPTVFLIRPGVGVRWTF